jgi:hypothetical protein
MKWSLKGFSEKFTAWIAKRKGKQHAKQGLDPMPDLVISAHLGEDSIFDPEGNEDHRAIERLCKPHPKLKTWQQEVRSAEEALTNYPKRVLLWVGFTIALGIEFAAMDQLLSGQGMEQPHRAVVAIAGACILFFLTYNAAKGAES